MTQLKTKQSTLCKTTEGKTERLKRDKEAVVNLEAAEMVQVEGCGQERWHSQLLSSEETKGLATSTGTRGSKGHC